MANDTAQRLVVFTKPARPGAVKTRLIGAIDAQQAAALHAAFRDDLIDRLVSGRFDLRIAWALRPEEQLPPHPIAGLRQEGSDLGDRLYRALASLAEGATSVAAVGSDHPLLAVELVEEAFERLERAAQVVLGPASDGGYYLIAVRAGSVVPRLFERIDWSTSRVLEQTLNRCRELELTVELLDEASDVDTPADLDALVRALADPKAPHAPRTRQVLQDWGRLSHEVPR